MKRNWRSQGRLGWLLSTLALAIALVLGSWTNYRSAKAAVATLNLGQAELLDAALRELVRPPGQLDSARLAAFLAAQTPNGLRYVGMLSPGGQVTLSAGVADPSIPLVLADTAAFGPRIVQDVGTRVRAYFPRGPLRGEQRGEGGWRGRGEFERSPDRTGAQNEPEGFRGSGPPLRPPRLHHTVLEFEPVVASALTRGARRSLMLALAGGSILTLAAVLFWRTSQQYQRAVLRLEEQRRLSLLGEMSAVLAHEIRNPLASLKGNAQLLAERLPADTREKTRVERVIAEATRLEALTTDLLDFARSGPLQLRTIDPAEVVRTSIDDVAEGAFDLDVRAAPERWTLDVARLRQALVNVLQNALQASPPDTRPAVRVASERNELIIEIRDFGSGLPQGSETRIFDPFFTTRTNGTGLGLAVARRVAELHGGRLTAANQPGGGALFRLALPPAQS